MMFRKNTNHQQSNLLGFELLLGEKKKSNINDSKYAYFYELIFCNIDEGKFASLYSAKGSRPNAPVNTMVSALILQNINNWSYDELFENIDFNLLTRKALGLSDLSETPFCQATLFYFQNAIKKHEEETGVNLLEQVFDKLSVEQLYKLKVKTNIQRTDSFLIGSNIRNFGRIQLLIEMLRRLHRVLTDDDKKALKPYFASYIKESSEKYVYQLKGSEFHSEFEKIAHSYYAIHQTLKSTYVKNEVFKLFERVYGEHFSVEQDKVRIKKPEELHSGCLQSPDDPDATYRKKEKQESKGQSVNVVETCHPDNKLNLITDVAVAANNVNDNKILNERLEGMKEKTPDMDELHTDAVYGSEENDKKMKKLEIKQVQTAITGANPAVKMSIEKTSSKLSQDSETYKISCPHQSAISQKTKKRHKANFDLNKCQECSLASKCPSVKRKTHRVYYFEEKDYLAYKRHNALNTIPEEHRHLRNNVEATVKEFKKDCRHGKLKVRGRFKTKSYAYLMAIGINFGRIYRHITDTSSPIPNYCQVFVMEKSFLLFKIKKSLFLSYQVV